MDSSSPDIDAANLNNIEDGISKAPYGPDSGALLIPNWNGSSWVYTKIVGTQIDAAAAIAYSKLALTGSIVNADIATGAALAYAKLNLAAAIKDSDIASAQNLSKLSGVTGTPDGTKFLSDAGSWLKPSGLTTYRKTTALIVNNTVADTDLLNGEITIAAGVMGTTGVVRATIYGDWINNSGVAQVPPRFKVKLGATTLLDTGTGGGTAKFATNAGRFGWSADIVIGNLGAANSQWARLGLRIVAPGSAAGAGAFTTGEGVYSVIANFTNGNFGMAEGGNAGAVDTTAANVLAFTVINPAASTSLETKLLGALVEVI